MFAYPETVVRTMRSDIEKIRIVIGVHFKNRHAYGNQVARHWIAAFKEKDLASGYSVALKQIKDKHGL